jgi:hypothetical protein
LRGAFLSAGKDTPIAAILDILAICYFSKVRTTRRWGSRSRERGALATQAADNNDDESADRQRDHQQRHYLLLIVSEVANRN